MPPDGQIPVEEADKKFIEFQAWDTIDTQSSRIALKPERPAWIENLQPIGVNELQTVPGPVPPLTSLPAGEIVSRYFYANYNNNDYCIAFCVSGSAYQIALVGGVVTRIAPAGTFSGQSDIAVWSAQRILIADPSAGYCTWDGTAFVQAGGVSPNFTVVTGGSGYVVPPLVTISGGSGGGATAVATVVAGAVTSIQLTNPGAGYKAGDVLTVSFSTGSATATVKVWPFVTVVPVSIAVFQSRVWLVGGRTLQFTGTQGFDDVSPLNAAGLQVFPDSDIVHSFTAIRSLNNYLYLFGDNSVRQIGTITVQSQSTLFTPTTLTSDQGTTFLQSIVSYDRLVVFANKVGVWSIYGASVEKISDPLDGIFQNIDFSRPIVSVLNDLRNIRALLVLARYNDPVLGTSRAIFLTLVNKKWFVVSQGNSILAAMYAPIGGLMTTWSSSGNDLTQILQGQTTPVSWLLRTALTPHKRPFINKRTMRIGVAHTAQGATPVTLTSDSETMKLSQTYTLASPIIWQNNLLQTVTWQNNALQTVTFNGTAFVFKPNQAQASGLYLGASVSGNSFGFILNGIVIEYQDGPAMRSVNHP